MAIVLDQILGSRGYAPGSGTSFNFTTTNAVASGAFIVVGWGYFPSPSQTVTSVSGGGLTWTVDKSGAGETGSFPGGGVTVGIASAQAPSGLASSTVITVNFSGTTDPDVVLGGASFTGVKTSSPVDGTPPLISGVGAAQAAWNTTSQSISDGSLLVGMCYFGLGGTLTSTPTAPAAEIYDVGDSVLGAGTMAYRIESSAGSYQVAGTWSSNTGQWLVGSVAYLADTGAPQGNIAWIVA